MNSNLFAESLQPQLLRLQKILRNIALRLLLLGVIIPTSQAIKIEAQNSDAINPKSIVTVEKVRKDNTVEIKEMTLEELQTDSELVNIMKFGQNDLSQVHLNLTSEKIQQIESNSGVFYREGNTVVDQSVLATLGYSLEQIALIQKMVDFSNLQTTKLIKISYHSQQSASKSNFFTIQAQAAPCQSEMTFDSQHWWGWRYFMNKCLVQNLESGQDFLSIVSLGSIFCPIACGIISFYVQLHLHQLVKMHNDCDEAGAFMNLYWSLDIDFSHVC